MSIQLLAGLEAEGITVPGADDYRTLHAALTVAPEPQLPARLLDLDPEALAAHIAAHTAWRASRDDRLRLGNALSRRLDDEMGAVLAGEAERIVGVLAPRFAEVADLARAVVAAGVRPDDTLETLALRLRDVIPTWLAFQGAPVRRLIHLANLRVELARATDEHGAKSVADLSFLVGPAGLLEVAPGRSLWAPWLAAAEHLRMLTPSEIDVDDVLTAKGYDVASIAREAKRREDAATPTASTATPAAPVPLPA